MEASRPARQPLISAADRGWICEMRGYCGPFSSCGVRGPYSDSCRRGTADCIYCCRRVSVQHEQEKRAALLARLRTTRPSAGSSRKVPHPTGDEQAIEELLEAIRLSTGALKAG